MTIFADEFNVLAGQGTVFADDFNIVTPGTSVIPGKPAALDVFPGDQSMRLSWLPPSDIGGSAITKYQLSVVSAGSPIVTTTYAADVRTTTVTGLTNGVVYSFTLSAWNTAGQGPGLSVQGTPAAATITPGPVRNLVAAAVSSTEVALSWQAPTTGSAPTSYAISSAPAMPDGEIDTGSSGTTYRARSLLPDTSYVFTITPIANGARGVPVSSAPVRTFVLGPGETPPPAPLPLPNFYAFPQPDRVEDVRVFRPGNFGKTIDEVPKGE